MPNLPDIQSGAGLDPSEAPELLAGPLERIASKGKWPVAEAFKHVSIATLRVLDWHRCIQVWYYTRYNGWVNYSPTHSGGGHHASLGGDEWDALCGLNDERKQRVSIAITPIGMAMLAARKPQIAESKLVPPGDNAALPTGTGHARNTPTLQHMGPQSAPDYSPQRATLDARPIRREAILLAFDLVEHFPRWFDDLEAALLAIDQYCDRERAFPRLPFPHPRKRLESLYEAAIDLLVEWGDTVGIECGSLHLFGRVSRDWFMSDPVGTYQYRLSIRSMRERGERAPTFDLDCWPDCIGDGPHADHFSAADYANLKAGTLDLRRLRERFDGDASCDQPDAPAAVDNRRTVGYSPGELAQMAGLSLDTIRDCAKAARVERPTVGGRDYRYPPADAIQILQAGIDAGKSRKTVNGCHKAQAEIRQKSERNPKIRSKSEIR